MARLLTFGLLMALALGALAEMPAPFKDSCDTTSSCASPWNGKPATDPVYR